MARAPILQLTDISLSFGGDPLFHRLDLVVQPGDRLALTGRNGSGKSTLLRLMAGLLEPDAGGRALRAGSDINYMEQDPDMAGFSTLGDFAVKGLADGEMFRVARAAQGLDLDLTIPTDKASGGERRRAALAGLLAGAPKLMLLDEPTNHLDIGAISWLEDQLRQTSAAFVVISHDRAFLRALSRATLWIDRGVVRRQDRSFDAFEDWRDTIWQQEDVTRHKLNRRIRSEAKWAVEGISARRKRNQGRVRALAELRAQRGAMIRRAGTAALAMQVAGKSAKRVIEARKISLAFDARQILTNFSIDVVRGDRIAVVGPNGVGKTSLIKMLCGQLEPDTGHVRLGSNVEMAVFDQDRGGLVANRSLIENLAGDPQMRVSGRADQIMVRGRARHVVGYLKDFLFDETQARAPVHSLSGGEKSRLLLARLLARQSNLLVLDEPTNDLDIETLDLLQDLLADYDGTVLLVSHDRDFVDRVATLTVAMEGDERAIIYAGGWSDYQAQRRPDAPAERRKNNIKKDTQPAVTEQEKAAMGLTFTEAHRLQALPDIIERLEAEIGKLSALLSDPGLFTREPVKFRKASEALVVRQGLLAATENEWLELSEK